MILGIGCAAAFALGLYAVLVRRDVVGILAGAELMVGAGNVMLVASGILGDAVTTGGFALVVLALAAVEASIGLALVMTAFRRTGRTRIDEFGEVSG